MKFIRGERFKFHLQNQKYDNSILPIDSTNINTSQYIFEKIKNINNTRITPIQDCSGYFATVHPVARIKALSLKLESWFNCLRLNNNKKTNHFG
jgi:hypothetical protein